MLFLVDLGLGHIDVTRAFGFFCRLAWVYEVYAGDMRSIWSEGT